MNILNTKIFIADDDADDRDMFEDALVEISSEIKLNQAKDGKELMDMLEELVPPIPDVIFLDLNMPLKNGFECLEEIRNTDKLRKIPIVIFSTSCDKDFIDRAYKQGADYYICKPSSFALLKNMVSRILAIDWQQQISQPSRNQFVIN